MIVKTLSDLKVLVVEDETMIALDMELLLEDHGCKIIGCASSIDAALHTIGSETVDCVVLDVNLNGEMTFDLADMLDRSSIPFLFVTGHEQHRLPLRFRQRPLIMKPYKYDEVINTLSQLVSSQ